MRGLIVASLAIAAPAAAQDVKVTVVEQADGTRTMTHEAVVPAGRGAVWEAVGTAAGWRSWAVPVVREQPDGKFETSYDPSAPEGGAATIGQQWVSRRAPRTAIFRTTRVPAGFPHADAYLKVVNTFTLTPLGRNATRVSLAGTGYPPGAGGDALLGFFRAGNTAGLQQLRQRFVTGPIDWKAMKEK